MVRPNAADRRNRSRLQRLNQHRPHPYSRPRFSAPPPHDDHQGSRPQKIRKPHTSKTRSCNVVAKSAASPALGNGVVAQLVERLVRNEKVRGSTPLGSTTSQVCSSVNLPSVNSSSVHPSPAHIESPAHIDALRAPSQPTTDLPLNRTRGLVYTAPLSRSPSDRSLSDSATPDSPMTHGVCEPTRASVFAHHTAPKTS